MTLNYPELRQNLEHHIQNRTGRRIRDLAVELVAERIILRGHTTTYYAKQLAQQGVREVLPDARLENAIVVA
jgi:hypothetical protein